MSFIKSDDLEEKEIVPGFRLRCVRTGNIAIHPDCQTTMLIRQL